MRNIIDMKAFKEDTHATRLAVIETIASQTNSTLIRLEQKIDKLENKMEEVKKENTSYFRQTIFSILTLIGTPLLIESIKLLTKFISG